MKELRSQAHKRILSLAVLALLVWLGGAGCALCCATVQPETCCAEELSTSHSTAVPPAEEVWQASKGQGVANQDRCCTSITAAPSSSTDSRISAPTTLKGCALLPNDDTSLAVIPRFGFAQPDPLTLTFRKPLPASEQAVSSDTLKLVNASPPERNETYLRCCVLLI